MKKKNYEAFGWILGFVIISATGLTIGLMINYLSKPTPYVPRYIPPDIPPPWMWVSFSDDGRITTNMGLLGAGYGVVNRINPWEMVTSSRTLLNVTQGTKVLHGPVNCLYPGGALTVSSSSPEFFYTLAGGCIDDIRMGRRPSTFFSYRDDEGIPFVGFDGLCFRIIEDNRSCYFVDFKWNKIASLYEMRSNLLDNQSLWV